MPLTSSWTTESAIAAGTAFIAATRRLPTSDDFRPPPLVPAACLPHWNIIYRLFGTMDAYLQALPAPPPPLLCRTPRVCLGCGTAFLSPQTDIRVCEACKKADTWREGDDLAWMNGVGTSAPAWLGVLTELIDFS